MFIKDLDILNIEDSWDSSTKERREEFIYSIGRKNQILEKKGRLNRKWEYLSESFKDSIISTLHSLGILTRHLQYQIKNNEIFIDIESWFNSLSKLDTYMFFSLYDGQLGFTTDFYGDIQLNGKNYHQLNLDQKQTIEIIMNLLVDLWNFLNKRSISLGKKRTKERNEQFHLISSIKPQEIIFCDNLKRSHLEKGLFHYTKISNIKNIIENKGLKPSEKYKEITKEKMENEGWSDEFIEERLKNLKPLVFASELGTYPFVWSLSNIPERWGEDTTLLFISPEAKHYFIQKEMEMREEYITEKFISIEMLCRVSDDLIKEFQKEYLSDFGYKMAKDFWDFKEEKRRELKSIILKGKRFRGTRFSLID